jgi:hemoglobin-like flavoprotein
MSLNVELLVQSFENVKPIAAEVSDKFYELLFEDYPQVKPMFKGVDLDSQKHNLVKSLVFIVSNLTETEKLSEFLRQMGKRHVDYGATKDHYPAVGKTLLKTFKFFFKDGWTRELETEWGKAYGVITSLMLEGASYREPSVDVIKKRSQILANQLILQALEEEFNQELVAHIRKKMRQVIFEVLEDESHNILKKSA